MTDNLYYRSWSTYDIKKRIRDLEGRIFKLNKIMEEPDIKIERMIDASNERGTYLREIKELTKEMEKR